MQLENTFTVPVPPDVAWRVLLDVERVAPCMPGATLDSVDGDTINGRVKVKVGPITVTYRGTATFVEKDEANHRAVIDASGKESRGSGTAKASVTTSMQQKGDQTEVKVVTDLNVTGKPAQFGRGVMADVSAKLIKQFADCLAEEIEHDQGAGAPQEPAPDRQEAEAAAPEQATASSHGAATTEPGAGPPAAPRDAAPAPATPMSRVTDAAAPTPSASTNGRPTAGAMPPTRPDDRPHRPRRTAEAIDLLDAAGAPIAKRLAPVAGVAALVALVIWLIKRRK